MTQEAPKSAVPPLPGGDGEHPGTVLIADDDASIRKLLEKFLRIDGYDVHVAHNGEEALRLMVEHRPDVVLLDLMMPGMSGYDVVRSKSQLPEVASTPVLMLTAVTQASVKVDGLELGISDYLTKPFDPPELRARVRNLVRMRRQEIELTRLNTVLAEQAITDPLTQLANRRGFEAYWEREVSRAERYRVPIALIIFDIDHFKWINDAYGHPAGDAVLIAVARLLGNGVRKSDLLARIGGEEFALVLPNADEIAAATVAEKLRCLISGAVIEPMQHPCTVSAGVASSAMAASDVLLTAADQALYCAKASGRNRVVLFSTLHGPAPPPLV